MAEAQELTGPDLESGVPLDELADGEPLLGHAGEEPVMMVRRGDEVLAIGAACTHYGGPLADGKIDGDRVYCPWHHACFSLRTGEALEAPALNPVARWVVEIEDGIARVTERVEPGPLADRGRKVGGPDSVVIVGAGAAGSAAAEMLRREGYGGPITMIDPEADAPYDRPNLSKDYLAGNAPEEWIPLRPDGFYEEHGIDRIAGRAVSLNVRGHQLELDDGRTLGYGALLLATGSSPRRLDVPGADLDHVHLLRSLDDCRRIVDTAESARRAVVIGSGFIGMESAASLRQRDIDVEVVSLEAVPFERTLGADIGRYLRRVHEEHGVVFHLESTVDRIEESAVRLGDGTEIQADLVLIGIGVVPETGLAENGGLDVDDGIIVDEHMKTSAPYVYAAGDIARYSHARTGRRVRVEHWVHAQRTGQAAAKNILGADAPYRAPPFFWTQQFEAGITYVGHAPDWEDVQVEGNPAEGNGVVRLIAQGHELAVIAVGRDAESLEAEVRFRAAD